MPNDLGTAKLPFDCSEICVPYLCKMADISKYNKILIFLSVNGNMVMVINLCTTEFPSGHSHSNANGN